MDKPKLNIIPNSIISMKNTNDLTMSQLILVLTHEHDQATVNELIRKFCLQSTSSEIIKKGMEFLYINGYYNDLQILINKNSEINCPSHKSWATVYQMMLDRKKMQKTPQTILQLLNNFQTDEPELKCLIEFLKIAAYYDLNQFDRVGNFLDQQQQLFVEVEDQYLLSNFNNRLYQHLFLYYWVRNELIMARKYAFRVLNQTSNPKTKANLHVNLGLTYTFDTYFQGMYHLSEALKITNKHNLKNIKNVIEQQNIPFLSAVFQKVEGISTDDKSEQAHIEIAKGNLLKSKEILQDIPINSPFRVYYLGMAEQNKDILLQSYKSFVEERSDHFFSRLPLNALRELGNCK
ncbi:AimR family lysis-lysogeny pheromone receptor [Virgibacillus byunsanensis]|uniref:AimR family lysis-lysogeny pheromone receptor n=1 Tax=Virgibacillus byunsanensis TaxID=570945 RepID=A0ABW3LEM7_9BACI